MVFKLINLWQTNDERKEKYHLAIALGCTWQWARVIRDWRLSKIERLFHLDYGPRYHNAPVMRPYAQFLLPGFARPQSYSYSDDEDALQSISSAP